MTYQSVADKIVRRVRGHGRGHVFTPVDFLDIAGRAAIDQALSRLVKAGTIRRLHRGLYDYPRTSPRFGVLSPSPTQVGRAIARKTGAAIRPSAAHAANALGLTAQVPARPAFETSGLTKDVRVGGQRFALRHRTPRTLSHKPSAADDVLRALRHLGPGSITDEVVRHLASTLSPRAKRALTQSKRQAPTWLHATLDRIARTATP